MRERGARLFDWICRTAAVLATLTMSVHLLSPSQKGAVPVDAPRRGPPLALRDVEPALQWRICSALLSGARLGPDKKELAPDITELVDIIDCRLEFEGPVQSANLHLSGNLRWHLMGADGAGMRVSLDGDGPCELSLGEQGIQIDRWQLSTRHRHAARAPRFERLPIELPVKYKPALAQTAGDDIDALAAEWVRRGGALAAIELERGAPPSLLIAREQRAFLLRNTGKLRFSLEPLETSPAAVGVYLAALPIDGAGNDPLVALVSSSALGKAKVELLGGASLSPRAVLELPGPASAATVQRGNPARLFIAGASGGLDIVEVSRGKLQLAGHREMPSGAVDLTFAPELQTGKGQLFIAGSAGLSRLDPTGSAAPELLSAGSFHSVDLGQLGPDGPLELLAVGSSTGLRERAKAYGWRETPALLAATPGAILFSEGAPVTSIDEDDAWAFAGALVDLDDNGLSEIAISSGLATESGWDEAQRAYLARLAGQQVPAERLGPRFFGRQRKLLFQPDGGGKLEEVGFPSGFVEDADGRSLLAVDLTGEGRLDLVMLGRDSPALVIFHNTGVRVQGRALALSLFDRSGAPEPGEAFVRARDEAGHEHAMLTSSGRGYHAEALSPVHLGLGESASAEVDIHWGEGRVSKLGKLEAGAWTVREGEPPQRTGPLAPRARAVDEASVTAAQLGLPAGAPAAALLVVPDCGACALAAKQLAAFAPLSVVALAASQPLAEEIVQALGFHFRAAQVPGNLAGAFAQPLPPGAVLLFDSSGKLVRVARAPLFLSDLLDETFRSDRASGPLAETHN